VRIRRRSAMGRGYVWRDAAHGNRTPTRDRGRQGDPRDKSNCVGMRRAN
jgi:hypothetical protein